jgi:hypothetical protein
MTRFEETFNKQFISVTAQSSYHMKDWRTHAQHTTLSKSRKIILTLSSTTVTETYQNQSISISRFQMSVRHAVQVITKKKEKKREENLH